MAVCIRQYASYPADFFCEVRFGLKSSGSWKLVSASCSNVPTSPVLTAHIFVMIYNSCLSLLQTVGFYLICFMNFYREFNSLRHIRPSLRSTSFNAFSQSALISSFFLDKCSIFLGFVFHILFSIHYTCF